MIRLSDLDNKMVVTAGGERLGRIHDILAEEGEVKWLEYGTRGLFERLRGHGQTERIAWSSVLEVRDDSIVVGAPHTDRSTT